MTLLISDIRPPQLSSYTKRINKAGIGLITHDVIYRCGGSVGFSPDFPFKLNPKNNIKVHIRNRFEAPYFNVCTLIAKLMKINHRVDVCTSLNYQVEINYYIYSY